MEALNQVAACSKPYKKLVTLETNRKYQVYNAKLTHGKYGQSVLLELEQCVVFLPKRYVDIITPDHIRNFNSTEYAVVIKQVINSGEVQTPNLEFLRF